MKHRNPFAVAVFSIITLGIYAIVWQVKTKNEMNKLGATIPTAWLIIIPIVNIWWLWKYCEGVEKATNGNLSGVLSFILLFILSIIGMAIVQSEFNKVGATANVPVGASASDQPFPNTPPQSTSQPDAGSQNTDPTINNPPQPPNPPSPVQ